MAPKEQELEPIKDKKVVDRYLRYAVEFREPASCLVERSSLGFEGVIKSYEPENSLLEIEVAKESFDGFSREQLREIDTPPSLLRFSFAVNDVLFYAHARVQGRKSRSLSVAVDLPIFKQQRREAVRIRLLDEHKASVMVGGKVYLPHDLSATGLSFVIMLTEQDSFPLKKTFPGCTLKFAGMECQVNMEVKSVTPMKKGDGRLFKVGFRFLGLSAAVEQKLAREAYLHTHKIWSRWL